MDRRTCGNPDNDCGCTDTCVFIIKTNMTQEQKWLSYVAELRSKHEAEMHEYGKELQGKILDQEFTIKSLVEDNRALKEAIEINCNCNADGCHNSKLLLAKGHTIGRLENDLSDGVKILETIWLAFDRDYLMKSLLSADYENLKNYLGK